MKNTLRLTSKDSLILIIVVVFLAYKYKMFYQPLIIALIIFLSGNILWFDKIILSRKSADDLRLKRKILNKIYFISMDIEKYRFVYNRLSSTIKHAKEHDEVLDINSIKEEINKISNSINEILPIKIIAELKSVLRINFSDNDDIPKIFNKYCEAFNKVNSFMIYNLIEDKDFISKKIDDFPELHLTNYYKCENKLISIILKNDSILLKDEKGTVVCAH